MIHIMVYLVIALAKHAFGCWSSSTNLRSDPGEGGYEFQFKTIDKINGSVVLKNESSVDNHVPNYQVEMREDLMSAFKCNFTGHSLYTCEIDNVTDNMLQQWHQVTNGDIDIGTITPIYGKKSQFIIKLMKFDNNTEFFMEIKSNFNTTRHKVKFPTFYSINLYNITNTIYYTEFEDVNFDCSNYSLYTNYIQVGLIDPSGDNISTLSSSKLQRKFNERDDRTILCCIYYIVSQNSVTVSKVQRYVENLSILRYYDPAAEPDDPSGIDGSGIDLSSTTYYIIGSVVGTIFLLVLFSMVIKKHSCTKRNTNDAIALQTYTNQNRVLYAELDITPTTERQVNITEESPYAEIIGVMKSPR